MKQQKTLKQGSNKQPQNEKQSKYEVIRTARNAKQKQLQNITEK